MLTSIYETPLSSSLLVLRLGWMSEERGENEQVRARNWNCVSDDIHKTPCDQNIEAAAPKIMLDTFNRI